MNKNLIAEMTLSDFKDFIKETDTAIFPVGATEGYGYHLPLGSDWIVTYEIARLAAKEAGCFVAPPITYGFSEDLMCYPGTLSVSTMTLISIYRDVIQSMQRQGIKKVLFLCGHVSNIGAVDQVAMEMKKDMGMESAIIDWWRFIYHINKDLTETSLPEGHAAEVGTSILLHLFPELVEKDKMIRYEAEDGDEVPDLYVYEYFNETTESSVLGDPFAGSARKGKVMTERAVSTISKFIKEW